MSFSFRQLRRSLLGVSQKEATAFSEGNTQTWKHLEAAVLAAIEGYHATLDGSKFEVLVPRLNKVPLELRGYAYEGAAMGLTGLDCLLPWKRRLQAYMAGPGSPGLRRRTKRWSAQRTGTISRFASSPTASSPA